MSFDRKTNTVRLATHSDYSADSGAFFAKVLRDLARRPGAPNTVGHRQVAADWATLAAWVGCGDREPTDADYREIGAAFRSYLGRGRSPSSALESASRKFVEEAVEQDWPVVDVPADISRVFDRMLATDVAIKSKKAEKAMEFAAAVKAVGSAPLRSLGLLQRAKMALEMQSRAKRAVLVLSLLWVAYATWRTSGSYQLFGGWLQAWDSDDYLWNVALPPLGLIASRKLYIWVTSAK